jgi:VCBS repeat-containing protein
MAIINGSIKAETINGTAQDDRIFGDNGNDTINGGAGNDFLDGGNGSDLLAGGAGNDDMDGGNGQDTALYAGNRADYRFLQGPNGSVIVRDLRSGSPDGTDRLFNMERVEFADGTFKLGDLIQANAAPVARNDALTLSETAGKTEVTPVLLANDSDADGDALKVQSVQAVSAKGATVTLGADGKVSYDAGAIFADLDNGETATDSFTYTITDGAGHTSTATAIVTITGITQNEAPVAVADELTMAEDAGATDVTGMLLANDSDPDGDAIQVSSASATSDKGAIISVSADGKVSYDAGDIFASLDDGETATDSFSYTITDSNGATSTATATVTITGVTQEAPEPDAYFYVPEDGTSENLLENLTGWLGFEITGAQETKGTLGSVFFDGQSLTFTADDDYSDHLNYDQHHTTTFTVTGANGEKAVIMAIVEGINDDIVAVDDEIGIGEGETSANLWYQVMGNDEDVDSFLFELLSVDTSSTQGQVAFDAYNRTLTYSAEALDLAPGEILMDSFSYVVDDGWGSTDVGTVFVTVKGNADGSVSASMAAGESLMAAFAPAGDGPAIMPTWDLGQAQTILGADACIA